MSRIICDTGCGLHTQVPFADHGVALRFGHSLANLNENSKSKNRPPFMLLSSLSPLLQFKLLISGCWLNRFHFFATNSDLFVICVRNLLWRFKVWNCKITETSMCWGGLSSIRVKQLLIDLRIEIGRIAQYAHNAIFPPLETMKKIGALVRVMPLLCSIQHSVMKTGIGSFASLRSHETIIHMAEPMAKRAEHFQCDIGYFP